MRRPRFLAYAECVQMQAFDGSMMTKEGVIRYAGESEGYLTSTSRASAKEFDSPEAALRALSKCDGMPWYYRFKVGTGKVEDVTNDTTRFSRPELYSELMEMADLLRELRFYASTKILSGGAHPDPIWAKVATKLDQYGKNYDG